MEATRFIKIGEHEFTIEELIQKLGIKDIKHHECCDVMLCQKVPDGYLAAISRDGEEDNLAPCIDVELILPAEKHSQSVLISRTEQKVTSEGGESQPKVRTYLYQRSNDSYVAYADTDARTDDEAEDDPEPAVIVVGGDGYAPPVNLYYENRFVEYCGKLGQAN